MKRNRPPLYRRKLLVDKSMQIPLLTYSVAMAAVGVVIASGFSVLWATSVAYGGEASPAVMLLGGLIAFGVMLFIGLVVTNRVAGPLYRLRLHMKAVADGEHPAPLNPREDDFTAELFREYNRMLKRVPANPAKKKPEKRAS